MVNVVIDLTSHWQTPYTLSLSLVHDRLHSSRKFTVHREGTMLLTFVDRWSNEIQLRFTG